MTVLKMNLILLAGFVISINGYGLKSERTTREPSIQAYGLPKRFLTGYNGHIESIHLDPKIEKEDSSHISDSASSVIGRKFKPRESTISHDVDGTIEIFHLDSSPESVFHSRNSRSIGSDVTNVANDLQAEETKVFRPLFAYRQQVLAKQRRQISQRESRNKAGYKNGNKNLPQLNYRTRSG